eukprot:TRINITY_DN22837_c0_g1_i1.p1 TRINITY_DN22837_c0_g1~~TRINITY_DN22837_c0_g1_i1.p1  ORF type:complete len:207 (-),score=61.39 TRINITY_DN22837_c0_g1_i1:72-614(-)
MKATVVLALAALGVVLAQTPPTISPSFTAQTVATFGNRTHVGQEYVDAQNQRYAFTHTFQNNNVEAFVGFTQNHTAYNFGTFNGTQHCQEQRDPRPFFNEWEWVAKATSSGSCTVGSTTGQGWTLADQQGKISLCANGNIPLQVTFSGQDGHTEVTTYASFTAGVPTPDKFSVPSQCRHH